MWNKFKGVLLFISLLMTVKHQVAAYGSLSKENIFADVLLTEILNRMDKSSDPINNYFDVDGEIPKSLDLVSRSSKNGDVDDYEQFRSNMFGGGGGGGGVASNPTIRDQEYLQHNSLWGHQYVSGGMAEMPNRYSTIVKTDSLPAYCNPPNPCPYGYEENQGCISDFENTAIFSREFQAAQECTCDSEHMFDCAGQDSGANSDEMSSTMEKFILHHFQNENNVDSSNSNAIVKKFYGFAKNPEINNPFLQGEKLPIAAKKGDHIQL